MRLLQGHTSILRVFFGSPQFLSRLPAASSDCARQTCLFTSLANGFLQQQTQQSLRKSPSTWQLPHLPEAAHWFSTDQALWRRGGIGQSETDRSLKRAGTKQEKPPVDEDLEDLDDDDDPSYEDVRQYKKSSPVLFASDLLDDNRAPSTSKQSSPAATVADRSRLPEGMAEADIPPELRPYDLSTKKKRKFVLQRILDGKEDVFGPPRYPPDTDGLEQRMEEWESYFRMKVVDVNRTSRGSPTGGIGRFSSLVVVGNGNGVIGLGMGKGDEIGGSIKKANRQAMKTLFFVPRYNQSTILHPVEARYGKCKVIMYPRSTGSGCKASDMISGICKLAGIQDIGVKVHGTRNVRNTVKALIRGFESQVIEEELRDLPSKATQAVRPTVVQA